jgi:hypothetical protein
VEMINGDVVEEEKDKVSIEGWDVRHVLRQIKGRQFRAKPHTSLPKKHKVFVKTEHDKNSFSYRIAMILLKMKCGER